MESAHLTKAHEHVRNAATATYGNSIATAGQEHELAASAFHEAAQDTHNNEALRIIGLLEDHHRKLAGLIKEPPRKRDKKKDTVQASDAPTTSPSPKGSASRTASPSTSSPSRAPSRRRLPQPSIASNLAEKRGIPGPRRGTPSATPVSVTNALANRNESPSTPVRDMLERQSRKAETDRRRDVPQSAKQEEKALTTNQSPPSSTEDNFRRFYTAFGGVISAISAPLAFTSLPLNPAPPTPAPDPPAPKERLPKSKSRNTSPEASRTVKSSEPDLAALISKPALRALREDGTAPLGPYATNESFYLVPTSGGTVSYANILQNPNIHHPHHAAQNPNLDSIDEGDNEPGAGLKGSSHEEFVDARETVGPPSPTASRRPRSRGKSNAGVTAARTIAAGRGAGLRTLEELTLENETLKNTVDKQSKRLLMWETTSQSSYNALAQSFRARKMPSDPSAMAQALAMGANAIPSAMNSPTPLSPSTPHNIPQAQSLPQPGPDPETVKRIAELEALVAAANAQVGELSKNNDSLARLNERNALVLGRYREQWEKLKAGARKKEQERREKKMAEAKAGGVTKESEVGDGDGSEEADVEGSEIVEEEPGFGKA
ncbi:hypothetical protein K458DRAFT_436036 [Lentithecium fluviatile CBS 122367]|uniref:Uncharacterized protein n=1 Tax=Lentithecium fluviatile CBS 122367 TaxID=1168545 RepID=A0A6G1IJQ1_9PLEO|nr:hypothetical protein K458DRAFT_436036 [Lentithecium fluviatile CBS 122367]